jgi:iron only hydrogenase large subunit-like protein
VSDTASPMVYAAQIAEKEHPEAKKVFISPCSAKKAEALKSGVIDYVLSFEELGALFVGAGIDLNASDQKSPVRTIDPVARRFAVAGGVSDAVLSKMPGKDQYSKEVIQGLTKENMKRLRTIHVKKPKNTLVEVMFCEGGCVGGPLVINNPKVSKKRIASFIENNS